MEEMPRGFFKKTQSVKSEGESSHEIPRNVTFHSSLVRTADGEDLDETHVAGG